MKLKINCPRGWATHAIHLPTEVVYCKNEGGQARLRDVAASFLASYHPEDKAEFSEFSEFFEFSVEGWQEPAVIFFAQKRNDGQGFALYDHASGLCNPDVRFIEIEEMA